VRNELLSFLLYLQMKYKLAKSGFMKNFEGSWEIEPEQFVSPTSTDGVPGTASLVSATMFLSADFNHC
jgi:hypothetical protein